MMQILTATLGCVCGMALAFVSFGPSASTETSSSPYLYAFKGEILHHDTSQDTLTIAVQLPYAAAREQMPMRFRYDTGTIWAATQYQHVGDSGPVEAIQYYRASAEAIVPGMQVYAVRDNARPQDIRLDFLSVLEHHSNTPS